MQELQSQLETKAKKSEEDKIAAENKVELIEVENRELKSKVNDLESEAGANGGELRDKVTYLPFKVSLNGFLKNK